MGALWLARFLPYKWIAIGIAFAALAAFAGWQMIGKANAERALAEKALEFSDYLVSAGEVVTKRDADIAALQQHNTALGVEVDAQFMKGKDHAAEEFQPVVDQLATLQALWRAGARPPAAGLRADAAAPGAGALPSGPDPAGVGSANACTDQPGRIIEAAGRVAADLKACGVNFEQLLATRAYALNVRCNADPAVAGLPRKTPPVP